MIKNRLLILKFNIIKITPLKLFLIGLVVVAIGAILRIFKIEYSEIILQIGLVIEVCSGIYFFIKQSNKKVA